MIDNYLKTGMAFHNSMDKQHFRNSCCKEAFCQITDKVHFPSFQIFSRLFVNQFDIQVYDLDDNLIVSPLTVLNINFYHHLDDTVTVSHDFRDGVVNYTAAVEIGACYYLRLRISDTGGPYYSYWYSEAFKVCNCDVIGVGDNVNLIENGQMEDWAGLANPNNYPLGWTLANNDATNFVADVAGDCQMISDNTQILYIYQPILTIGEWYVWSINVTVVTAGSIRIEQIGGAVLETINTTGRHTGVFQATHISIGIVRGGVCDVTFGTVRVEEFVGYAFCDMITLNWWSDCDWDNIIYQYGYRNSLVLNADLDSPKEDIVQNAADERLGEKFFSDIVIKKIYRISERIPEYIWNALIRLVAYGSEMPNFHCWITFPQYDYDILTLAETLTITTADTAPMSEVAVLGEWDNDNCMNTFTIEFVDNDEYPVVAGNCCKDEDVSEI